LAPATIQIRDTNGQIIKGEFENSDKGKVLLFTPVANWRPGRYILEIESRLEDLAGNNMNRLFDEDLTQKKSGPKDVYTTTFEVQ
jgi:hypothetical protein